MRLTQGKMSHKWTKKEIFNTASLNKNCVVTAFPGYLSIRNMKTGVSIRFWDDRGGQHRDDVRLDLALSLSLPQSARALNLRRRNHE